MGNNSNSSQLRGAAAPCQAGAVHKCTSAQVHKCTSVHVYKCISVQKYCPCQVFWSPPVLSVGLCRSPTQSSTLFDTTVSCTRMSQCSQTGQKPPQMSSKLIGQLITNICCHTAPCDERNWAPLGNDHPSVN